MTITPGKFILWFAFLFTLIFATLMLHSVPDQTGAALLEGKRRRNAWKLLALLAGAGIVLLSLAGCWTPTEPPDPCRYYPVEWHDQFGVLATDSALVCVEYPYLPRKP